MPRSGKPVIPEAQGALDRFKWEIAHELGLAEKVNHVGWGEMTTREVGQIGGQMVKRMIDAAQDHLIWQSHLPK